MAIVSADLFFRKNRSYAVGNISFDMILSETHNLNNTVSQYKVENGSPVSDHIENELENGSATYLITNFSINDSGEVRNRAQEVYDELYDLWKRKELVKIVTVFKVYTDMAIQSLAIPRDEGTGEALFLNISFRKFNRVKLKEVKLIATVNIKDTKSDQNRQASENVDVGRLDGIIRNKDIGAKL